MRIYKKKEISMYKNNSKTFYILMVIIGNTFYAKFAEIPYIIPLFLSRLSFAPKKVKPDFSHFIQNLI